MSLYTKPPLIICRSCAQPWLQEPKLSSIWAAEVTRMFTQQLSTWTSQERCKCWVGAPVRDHMRHMNIWDCWVICNVCCAITCRDKSYAQRAHWSVLKWVCMHVQLPTELPPVCNKRCVSAVWLWWLTHSLFHVGRLCCSAGSAHLSLLCLICSYFFVKCCFSVTIANERLQLE